MGTQGTRGRIECANFYKRLEQTIIRLPDFMCALHVLRLQLRNMSLKQPKRVFEPFVSLGKIGL